MNDKKKERSTEVTSQATGEKMGSGADIDGLPMGSVIYMGRGSFRMEAVALEAEDEAARGVVQPVTGIVTAPLHAPTRAEPTGNASERAPRVRSLFGSQADVPLLAAPVGSASWRAEPAVTLSRPMLATLGGVILLCGIVVGTAVRHLVASPAPLSLVAVPTIAAAPSAVIVGAPPIAAVSTPEIVTAPPPPPVVALPVPMMIRARTKPAPKPTATKATGPSESAQAPAKPWVDPWAS
jgi:hypothetical protein